MLAWTCCLKAQRLVWTLLWTRVHRAAPVQVCVYHSARSAGREAGRQL